MLQFSNVFSETALSNPWGNRSRRDRSLAQTAPNQGGRGSLVPALD